MNKIVGHLLLVALASASVRADCVVSDRIRLSAIPDSSKRPVAAWSGSEYGVSWVDYRDSTFDVYFTRVDLNGDEIGSEDRITNTVPRPLENKYIDMVSTGADYGIAWFEYLVQGSRIYFDRVDLLGNPLGGSLITEGPVAFGKPSLVFDDFAGEYGIAWADQRHGSDEIYFARLDLLGNKIGAEVRITSSLGDGSEPSLVWTGGEYGLAWTDDRTGQDRIFFARIDAAGNKIGSDVMVTTEYSTQPSIVWADTHYGIAYRAIGEIKLARLDINGVALGSPSRISDLESHQPTYPSLVWSGLEYGAAWRETRNGPSNTEIYFARLEGDGSKIEPDIRISNDPSSSDFPELTKAGTEYGLVWHDSRDGTLEVYFAKIGCVIPEVCFYVEPRATRSSGHAFLEVKVVSGGDEVAEQRGYHPKTGNYFWSEAEVLDNELLPWGYKICYPVTSAKANAVIAGVNADALDPPAYHLFFHNCVDWIKDMAALAGLALPSSRDFWFGWDDPQRLHETLESIGDGGTYRGGVVTSNPAPSQGFASAEFCRDYGFEEMREAGHADPAGLAIEAGLAYQPSDLGTILVGSNQALTLNIEGASPLDSLRSVDWGDGSNYEAQLLSFAHTYDLAGDQALSLIVIDSGAITHFFGTVSVVDGLPSVSIDLAVPSTDASDVPNMGCEVLAPIPPLDTAGGPGTIPLLRLDRGGAGTVVLSWAPSPCSGAIDYGIYEGTLGSWQSHEAVDCHDDFGDLSEEVVVGEGDSYFLVVPLGSETEGSYGRNSDGQERLESAQSCAPAQDLQCQW